MKICFDVDGTLITDGNPSRLDSNGEPLCDTPRYEIIQLFKAFEALGWEMFIWSGGGVDYAERWRDKLGLTAKVVPKGSFTPNIAVDDIAGATIGKVVILV